MAEYIEREKLIEHLKKDPLFDLVERYGITGVIEAAPAADVRPAVRGSWKERRFSEDVYGAECSVCHTTWDYGTKFCPNCGADMREES